MDSSETVHGFSEDLSMLTAPFIIDKLSVEWYHITYLVVTEDRATQECDHIAGYGVGGKSDAMVHKSVKNGQLKKTPSYGRIEIDLKLP